MRLIQLEHRKDLGMPATHKLHEIKMEYIQRAKNDGCDVFLSFRNYPVNMKVDRIKNVSACTRLREISSAGDIAVFGIEDDTFLSLPIIWNIAHQLHVGQSIHFYGDLTNCTDLDRDYYKNSFQKIVHNEDHCQYIKNVPLVAEEGQGLEDWTFGIPVGPGDATILNVVVKRILELPCRNKEIILCGRPGGNFRYWDSVKIVGEDIPAPPVRICRKKNCIAQNAKYENLCILHDRVFLPSDFIEAMKRYGDNYPVLTMQSLYFDDYKNRRFYRYSDYNTVSNSYGYSQGVLGVRVEENNITSTIVNSGISGVFGGKNEFAYQNPLRYEENSYATGSLYIVKKRVWNYCPLDDSLNWEEFEDVEWGHRCAMNGVPHLVNPYSMAQSVIARSIILNPQGLPVTYPDGKVFKQKGFLWRKKTKPLIKCTENEAWHKIMQFRAQYCPNLPLKVMKLSAQYRTYVVIRLLCAATFELTPQAVNTFLRDVETKLLYVSLYPELKMYTRGHLFSEGRSAIQCLLFSLELRKQLALRWNGEIFMRHNEDYGVPNSRGLRVGSFVSAFMLNLKNARLFYHPDGLCGYYHSIINSTPFLSYFEVSTDEKIRNK